MTILDPEKWSALPPGATPLSGNEIMAMVQSGQSVQVPSNYVSQPGASYLVLTANPYLNNSRTLVPGANITFVDGGPGQPLTISSPAAVSVPVVIAEGGTGRTALAGGSILYGPPSGTAMLALAIGASNGKVLVVSGGAPVWGDISGTTDRITTNILGVNPTIDIAANYAGQSSITTLGTITTGVWNGTIVSVAKGGTGTATPGLISGANISITGTWPNQTITSSGGGGGTVPAGNNTQIQYNIAGAFTADAGGGLGWTAASGTLTLGVSTNSIVTPGAAATVTSAGRSVTLQGGPGGSTSGNGGSLAIQGGLPVEGDGGSISISGRNAVTATATDRAGGSVTISSGNSVGTTQPGGVLSLSTGTGSGSGKGGTLQIIAGAGGSTGIGGEILIVAGAGGASGTGGQVTINGGNAHGVSFPGGGVQINGGIGSPTTGAGGPIAINGGEGGVTSGDGGTISLVGGTANSGVGGSVGIFAGDGGGVDQNGGSITLTAGDPTGTAVGGSIALASGTKGSIVLRLGIIVRLTVDDNSVTIDAPVSGDSLTVAPSSSSGALMATSSALTTGAGASAGTITNAPSVGNPTKWIKINDAGTIRSIPAW